MSNWCLGAVDGSFILIEIFVAMLLLYSGIIFC